MVTGGPGMVTWKTNKSIAGKPSDDTLNLHNTEHQFFRLEC